MKRMMLVAVFTLGIVCLAGAQLPQGPEKNNRPIGTWEQTAGDVKITLTITADRLRIITTGKDNKPLWLIDADYSVTKDSILYGIVTSVEDEKKLVIRPPAPPAPTADSRPAPLPSPAPTAPSAPSPRQPSPSLIEQPSPTVSAPQLGMGVDDLFSFRFRVDDDILTIKETKAKPAGGRCEFILQGRFKKKGETDDNRRLDKSEERKDLPKEPLLKKGEPLFK